YPRSRARCRARRNHGGHRAARGRGHARRTDARAHSRSRDGRDRDDGRHSGAGLPRSGAGVASAAHRGFGPPGGGLSGMSSHREAPEIAKDPVADSTDLYAFVSPDHPDTVTLIANYVPLQGPAGGPNFYEFGDDVLYDILIDNDGDGKADIVFA